jgi:acetyl-CoA C-acetyltransferase
MTQAYILDARRTPRGRGKAGKGALSGIHPQELMAQTLDALAERLASTAARSRTSSSAASPRRGAGGVHRAQRGPRGRLADEVTGVTLNRFCGSGLQAVNFAAMGVMSGQQDLVVGGGVESMSRVPMGSDEAGSTATTCVLREKVVRCRRASAPT